MAKAKQPTQKRRIVRLLPLTVTMLSLLFIVKMNEVYLGSKHLREIYAVRDAVAEEKKPEAKPEEKAAEPAKEAGNAEAKKADAKASAADVKPEDAKKEGETKEAEGEKAAEGDKEKAEKPVEEERTHGTGKTTVKAIEELKAKESQPRYTQNELDLLQNLSKRRDELDRREKDLEIKAKVLEVTDKRIADKMNEMKTLQADLSKVLAQYNEKQDMQIKSLVKIYESMKPDEAAAIFNEMDMPILLEVIAKMSERKVAPVLANMSPKKARDVTQELAEKRKKTGGAGDAVKP
jgi:flagellar motility protein MotE (MotC chaperone)